MEKVRQHAQNAGLKRSGSKLQADLRLEQANDVSKRGRMEEAPLIPLRASRRASRLKSGLPSWSLSSLSPP